MNQEQYQLIKTLIKNELEVIFHFNIDDITFAKYIHMFWTGIEITTNDGKIHEVYPLGPFRRWLIEAMNQEKNPYKKTFEDINPIKEMRFTGKNITDLLPQTENDPVAWDAAKMLATKINEQGDELPKELNEFVIKTLNSNGPIKKRGPSKNKKLQRNLYIIMLILELERIDISYATKSSCYSETLSICDAVVEVLHDLGKPIDYDAVKSVYDNRNFLNNPFTFRLDISENIDSRYSS